MKGLLSSQLVNPSIYSSGRAVALHAMELEASPQKITELKLETHQLEEKIARMRTILTRTQRKYIMYSAAINRTLEQNSEYSPTIRQNTSSNLRRSISVANNSLKSLRQKLIEAKDDDRLHQVHELEEDCKLAYLEKNRIEKLIQKERAGLERIRLLHRNMSTRNSVENLTTTKSEIKRLKEQNREILSKQYAYIKKLKKIQIELNIMSLCEGGKTNLLDSIEIEQAEDNDRLNKLNEQVNQKNKEHKNKIQELKEIINRQLMILQDLGDFKYEEQPDSKTEG